MNVPTTSNKYDDIEEDFDNLPYVKYEGDELKLFMQYNMGKLLPAINNQKNSLGPMDEMETPRILSLWLEPSVNEAWTCQPGRNHADHIDKHGYYDIIKMLKDHKEIFPGINNVGVGQYGPYISTEVYFENLFNKSGYISQPNRANKRIRKFERSVISKHRLQRIFCDHKKVERFHLKRHANNEWDDNGERDYKTFSR